jgi:nicotinate (nicotinamide) nucleotide adenylyltransferase
MSTVEDAMGWQNVLKLIKENLSQEVERPHEDELTLQIQRALSEALHADALRQKEAFGDAAIGLLKLAAIRDYDALALLQGSLARQQKKPGQLKVALIGTSANPITNGHLTMGMEILALTDVDEVWYYLVGKHAWGKKLMPAEHRLAMARVATKPYARLKVCDFEITQSEEIYKKTMETAEIMRDFFRPQYPKHQFSWVMGSDVAQSFHMWKGSDWMAGNMDFHIIHRLGYEFEKDQSLLADPRHIYFKDEIVTSNISSSLVRNRGRDYEHSKLLALVPNSVWQYLVKHRLLDQDKLV